MPIPELPVESNRAFSLELPDGRLLDFSVHASVLGNDFLSVACRTIREQDDRKFRTARTWKDSYAVPYGYLITQLAAYVAEPGVPSFKGKWDDSQWTVFANSLTEKIREHWPSATRSKKIWEINHLFTLLRQSGAVAAHVEVDANREKKRGRFGKSKFTQRGHSKIAKVRVAPSEFGFECSDGDLYDYAEFSQLMGPFLLAVLPAIQRYFSRVGKNGRHNLNGALNNFLRWLLNCQRSRVDPSFFERLATEAFADINEIEWEEKLFAWRASVIADPVKGETTQNQTIQMVNRIWGEMAIDKSVPAVVIPGPKAKKGQTRKRANLVQAVGSDLNKTGIVRVVFERLRKFFADSDQNECFELIGALCATGKLSSKGPLNLVQIIQDMHSLNEEILSNMRAAAEADFLKWHAHWQHGQKLIDAVTDSVKRDIAKLSSDDLSNGQIMQLSGRLFFSGTNTWALGNGLYYVLVSQGGLVSGLGGRYSKIVRKHGGLETFHAYMHPHPEATLALWVMMLIDSGANTEVTRRSPRACISKSEKGHYRIGFDDKARAGGKPICDEFPLNPAPGCALSLPQAILYYQEMSSNYHAFADAEFKGLLLLYERGGHVTCPSENTARTWFTKFRGRHLALAQVNANPSMIRPSALLKIQHQNGGRIEAAQAIADHANSKTTMGYTGKVMVRLAYDLKLREFIERFEAIVCASIEGAAEKLGISPEEFAERVEAATKTGLGILCLDPFAGIQPQTNTGKPCHRLEKCCQCEMQWVHGTVENIVDLMLFNRHLNDSQDEMYAKNADRWIRRWLPWLVFSNIALAKLAAGETASAFARAAPIAEVQYSTYQPIPLD